MSATAVTLVCLKRKRDALDARDVITDSLKDLPLPSPPSQSVPKRSRSFGLDNDLPVPDPSFLPSSSSKSIIPTSSCRLDRWRNQDLPTLSIDDSCTESQEAGPSMLSDLQHSMHAFTIGTTSTRPSKTTTTEPFGFDTTLSKTQYGYSRTKPYRFTSPLSPDPARRKRSKCKRRGKLPLPSLLKVTLRRNHILSLRKRYPEILRPVSPTHPDSCPQLQVDDDDEFDDDEDDEIIDDFDNETQVDDILNLYSSGSRAISPEPEPVQPILEPISVSSTPEIISLPDTILCLSSAIAKHQPIQTTNLSDLTELASMPRIPIMCNT